MESLWLVVPFCIGLWPNASGYGIKSSIPSSPKYPLTDSLNGCTYSIVMLIQTSLTLDFYAIVVKTVIRMNVRQSSIQLPLKFSYFLLIREVPFNPFATGGQKL